MSDHRSLLKVIGGALIGLGSLPILMGAAAAYLLLPAVVSVGSVACLCVGGYLIIRGMSSVSKSWNVSAVATCGSGGSG